MKTLIEKIKAEEVLDTSNIHTAYNRGLDDAIAIVEAHTCEYSKSDLPYTETVRVTGCGERAWLADMFYPYCPHCMGRIVEAEK